jgi:hypothetical protein
MDGDGSLKQVKEKFIHKRPPWGGVASKRIGTIIDGKMSK